MCPNKERMNERYMEIYSKHRNRTMYPNPSYFEIPFSFSSKRVFDPVLNGLIYFTQNYSPILDYGTLGTMSTDSVLVLNSS